MIRQGKGDWTEIVGRSLRKAEETPPAGGWERLERELRVVPLSARSRSPRRLWIRYTAAAASILLFATIGVQVLRMNHNVTKIGVVSVSETAAGGQSGGTETHEVSVPSSLAEPDPLIDGGGGADRSLASGNRSGGAAFDRGGDAVPEIASERPAPSGKLLAETHVKGSDSGGNRAETGLVADRGEDLRSVLQTPARLLSVKRAAQPTAEKVVTKSAPYHTDDYDGLFAEAVPAVRKKSGAAGVFAAGAFGNSGSGGGEFGPLYSSILENTKEIYDLRDAYDDYSFEHLQPFSVGLTFRKEFRYGLSLETGLNYTLLRSEVTITGRMNEVRQKLHFIGIPLRVNWQFLQVGRFSMYVGAGGMAEKCVSAHFGPDKMSEKSVQWSLSGIVGAQCRLGRFVGIYFEPAVSHYLTRTTLRTSYTDSKAVVDLRFGLRFTY